MTFNEFKEQVITDLPSAAAYPEGFTVTEYGYKFSTPHITTECWYNTAQQKWYQQRQVN